MAPSEADLEAEVKKLEAEFDAKGKALDALSERAEKQLKDLEALGGGVNDQIRRLEQELKQVQTRLNRPGVGGGQEQDNEEAAAYQKAFVDYLRRGRESPELKALVTDDPAQGGFVVPEPMRAAMIEELVEISPIRANAAQQTIAIGDALDIPVDKGGFGTGWVGEREARTETDTGTLGMRNVPLREQYAFPHVSQKMLDDASINVEQWVGRKLAEVFAKQENLKFLKGNDVVEPQGIFTEAARSGTKIEVNETATSGSLAPDDIIDLIYELPTDYAQGGQLYAHRKIIRAMRKFKDDNDQYLWQQNLQQGEPATFAGVPVVEVPDMDDSVVAGKHVLMFSNLQRSYQVVDKSTVGVLRDPYTNKPFVGFYTTRRVGGRVKLPEAIAVLKVKS